MSESKTETKIIYYVSGISYDKNDTAQDYDVEYGSADNRQDARKLYDDVVQQAEQNSPLLKAPLDVATIIIQLEMCEVDDNSITCVDVLAETSFCRE